MVNTSEKIPLNDKLRAIFNYCFRVLIFLFLTRTTIINFITKVFDNIIFLLTKNLGGDDGFVTSIFIFMFIPFYILPKVCGLFKKLDNLNIILAVIIILIVDVIFSYSQALIVQINPFKISCGHIYHVFILIWFFLLYKFFNFLTRIFPTPFKQIGYIFSIELLKDIYKDVKKDINENYLRKEKSE